MCSTNLSSATGSAKHILRAHRPYKISYVCGKCTGTFPSQRKAACHLPKCGMSRQRTLAGTRYLCDHCPKSFSTTRGLFNHKRTKQPYSYAEENRSGTRSLTRRLPMAIDLAGLDTVIPPLPDSCDARWPRRDTGESRLEHPPEKSIAMYGRPLRSSGVRPWCPVMGRENVPRGHPTPFFERSDPGTPGYRRNIGVTGPVPQGGYSTGTRSPFVGLSPILSQTPIGIYGGERTGL